MAKGSDNPFPKITFVEQLADAGTPPAGQVYVFLRDDGIFYQIDDAGTITPWGAGSGSGGSSIGGAIEITEQTPPVDRGVTTPGGWVLGGSTVSGSKRKTLVQVTSGNRNFLVSAAPATNPRIDIITIDSAGTIAGVIGTQSATPVPPTLTNSDQTPIYLIHQRVGSTAILSTDNGVDSYLEDIRAIRQANPWVGTGLNMPSDQSIIKDPTGKSTLTLFSSLIALNATSADAGASIYMYANATGKHRMLNGHGLVFPTAAADPAGGDSEAGQVYYNTTTNKLRCYNGTTWNDLF